MKQTDTNYHVDLVFIGMCWPWRCKAVLLWNETWIQ